MRGRNVPIVLGLVLAPFVMWVSPAVAAPGASGEHARTYYVSVGTSLAAGIQPDVNGENQRTEEGYADQLHTILQASARKLRLVKLGCPGETSLTMIVGGICAYPKGSQLAEAVAFLRAHGKFVSLVTIDMGANDLLPCAADIAIDLACVNQAFAQIAVNLPQVLSALREAAGPDVPIVAMNYYNPFLATWLLGPEGQAVAMASAALLGAFNAVLGGIYGVFSIPVADVAAAFQSADFTIVPDFGIPVNVLLICQWTWMCVLPPQGPNIHANVIGYGVIAETFTMVLP